MQMQIADWYAYILVLNLYMNSFLLYNRYNRWYMYNKL